MSEGRLTVLSIGHLLAAESYKSEQFTSHRPFFLTQLRDKDLLKPGAK
jgi:hypothetical protein